MFYCTLTFLWPGAPPLPRGPLYPQVIHTLSPLGDRAVWSASVSETAGITPDPDPTAQSPGAT